MIWWLLAGAVVAWFASGYRAGGIYKYNDIEKWQNRNRIHVGDGRFIPAYNLAEYDRMNAGWLWFCVMFGLIAYAVIVFAQRTLHQKIRFESWDPFARWKKS
ncbi:MAG: hypothetical protein HYT22_02900 [Candidatus Niyogibacteria bacterium]|nr:hypothetical protein [Candidatus Niyogibacteria bacterium]